MSAEKTVSLILSAAPYRETSCILRLFTRSRGLVHGIAKGARRGGGKSTPTPLDRGLLLEALLYHRPNRELHTLGSLQVANFFHGIRANITKAALRDIAIELYLKTVTEPSPHPELFDLLFGFLGGLDGINTADNFNNTAYTMLWRFIGNYCEHNGFGIDTGNYTNSGINSAVVKILSEKCRANSDTDIAAPPSRRYSKDDCINVTAQLLRYCQRHFDIRAPFNSLEFVKSLL
jgi:DNA repair protein RecO (recombination protein O)